MDTSKKTPKMTEVDLDEFLGELVSIIKKKLDQQQGIVNDLKKRVTALESRKSPESIVEEKLSEVTESISNIKRRLASLEEVVKTPKTVSTGLLEVLGGKPPGGGIKETKEER